MSGSATCRPRGYRRHGLGHALRAKATRATRPITEDTVSNEENGHGLRARSRRGRIGRTWWSERWTGVLETIGLGDRLHRGRSLARSGSVLSLAIAPGEVRAEVLGTRRETYEVRIAMDPILEEEWEALEEVLSRQALFAARLLSGEMPPPIEEAFAEVGLTLFPSSSDELESECTCSDPAHPCPHAAAVFYLMAERFDEDPFLIFLFRGRRSSELLGGLKQRWAHNATNDGGGEAGPQNGDGRTSCDSERSGTRLNRGAKKRASKIRGFDAPADGDGTGSAEAFPPELTAGGGEPAPSTSPEGMGTEETGTACEGGDGKSSSAASESRPVPAESFWELGADLDAINPRIAAAVIPEALLRRLGPPPGATEDSLAQEALQKAYRIASAWALKLATRDVGTED
jgi:uncharacterized Zn finger protein